MEHIWKPLYDSIKSALQTQSFLQTREQRRFRRPNQVKRLRDCHLHGGLPILPDLPDEIYLAPEYAARYDKCLEDLGVDIISWDDIVNRLQADLTRTTSKVRTIKGDDPWHVAFAELFLEAFAADDNITIQQRIRKLAIIPLSRPNQWTGAPGVGRGGSDKIFFPYTKGTAIPETLSLRLLEKSATANIKRSKFYETLGIKRCSTATVCARIKELHCAVSAPWAPTDHLRYLFYRHHRIVGTTNWVWVPLTNDLSAKASSCELYFPSAGEFDTYQLLQTYTNVRYLSSALVTAVSPTVRVNDITWATWLARTTGARYHPPLMSELSLSPSLKAVLIHAPKKFLSTLRSHWNEYGTDAHLVSQQLRECEVPCATGSLVALRETYLPTVAVMGAIHDLGLPVSAIPVLTLPEGRLDESSYRSWRFLKDFGAASKPDLAFYMLAVQDPSDGDAPDTKQIAEIYKNLVRLATVQDNDDIR